MQRTLFLAMVLILGAIGPMPSAMACPLCKDAIAAANPKDSVEDDPLREAKAYNSSILFMLSMPYVVLASFGLLYFGHYRAAQKQIVNASQISE
jgi:hypothetical protein